MSNKHLDLTHNLISASLIMTLFDLLTTENFQNKQIKLVLKPSVVNTKLSLLKNIKRWVCEQI